MRILLGAKWMPEAMNGLRSVPHHPNLVVLALLKMAERMMPLTRPSLLPTTVSAEDFWSSGRVVADNAIYGIYRAAMYILVDTVLAATGLPSDLLFMVASYFDLPPHHRLRCFEYELAGDDEFTFANHPGQPELVRMMERVTLVNRATYRPYKDFVDTAVATITACIDGGQYYEILWESRLAVLASNRLRLLFARRLPTIRCGTCGALYCSRAAPKPVPVVGSGPTAHPVSPPRLVLPSDREIVEVVSGGTLGIYLYGLYGPAAHPRSELVRADPDSLVSMARDDLSRDAYRFTSASTASVCKSCYIKAERKLFGSCSRFSPVSHIHV